jgi:hypothetical protein
MIQADVMRAHSARQKNAKAIPYNDRVITGRRQLGKIRVYQPAWRIVMPLQAPIYSLPMTGGVLRDFEPLVFTIVQHRPHLLDVIVFVAVQQFVKREL